MREKKDEKKIQTKKKHTFDIEKFHSTKFTFSILFNDPNHETKILFIH